jgi:hypothetical protein
VPPRCAAVMPSWSSRERITWTELLWGGPTTPIVLVAPSLSGKTTELERRVGHLRKSGMQALYCEARRSSMASRLGWVEKSGSRMNDGTRLPSRWSRSSMLSTSCTCGNGPRSADCRVQRSRSGRYPSRVGLAMDKPQESSPVSPRVSRSRASSKGVCAQRSAPQVAGQHVKAHGVTSRSRRSAVASRTGRVRLCFLLLLFTQCAHRRGITEGMSALLRATRAC